MAESNIMEKLQQRVGPAPLWMWIVGVAALAGGYMVIKKNKASVAGQPSNPSGASGGQGQFQSSQSKTTTDAQGNTTTSQYSATGQSPFGIPGYLTQQGYPMPYSLGDIYNNISTEVPVTLPATTNNTTVNLPPQPIPTTAPPPPQVVTIPAIPPQPAPTTSVPDWAQPGATWTVDPGNSLWYIASRVLEGRLGRPPSNGEIANYWPAIYAANRGVIGGNPDLIRPGQNFVLP